MRLNRLKRPLPIATGILFILGIVFFQNCGGSFKVDKFIPSSEESQPASPIDSSSTSTDIPAEPPAAAAQADEAICLPVVHTLVVANTSSPAGAAISNVSNPASMGTAGNYTFVVPSGVNRITVKVWGGGGASSGGGAGGGGAYVTGQISVTPGETLEVGVAQGGQATAQAQNIIDGGGGGGMSYIQRVSNGQMLVIAAGGGGAGFDGNSGASGINVNGAGGAGGGTSGFPGGNVIYPNYGSGNGGGGATQSAPGTAGLVTLVGSTEGAPVSGSSGSFFAGGDGTNGVGGGNRWKGGTKGGNGAAGGGGAGLYGGGSGSSRSYYWGAGGGGGSSYIIPTATASILMGGQGRIVANSTDSQLPAVHGNGGLNSVTSEFFENQGVPAPGQPGFIQISWTDSN